MLPVSLMLTLPAQATTLVSLDLASLTDAADTIVRGTVTEVWTELEGSGMVWTYAQVEVTAAG